MYRFNVYENYANGGFRLLTTYSCFGANKEEARAEAQAWAEATYPDTNVDVMSTN